MHGYFCMVVQKNPLHFRQSNFEPDQSKHTIANSRERDAGPAP